MSSLPQIPGSKRSAISSIIQAPTVSRRTALRGLTGLSAALLLTAAPRLARAESERMSAQSGAPAASISVVGAWELVFRGAVAGESGPDRVLASFAAEGGFQAALTPGWRSAAGSLRFHGGGHGSWTASGDGVIEAGYTALTYDESGACDGSRQVSIRASIDGRASLTGTYVSRVYDADGALIDLVSGAVDGAIAG
jgi:hypothetical protein